MRDTIVAIATAPIVGAIGIVRLSGPSSITIADKLFFTHSKLSLSDNPPRTMVYGNIISLQNKKIDSCLACYFKAPNSYTGEDMVEFHCHGSMAILSELINIAYNFGAVYALPGEFTKRAFLNNKLSLVAAEAVNDIISAQTVGAAENAVAQLSGCTCEKIFKIRDEIVSIVAHFHAVVDYPDEEIDPFLFEKSIEILHNSARDLYNLAESFERGRLIKEGIPCVIIGRPNGGKSSLLNYLAGYERAIVTDIAGTTRDIIEESIKIGSLLLKVCDTAGIRDTVDIVEKIGVELAMKKADSASIILAVFDGSRSFSEEDLMVIAKAHKKTSIAVLNKKDLPFVIDIEEIKRHFKYVVSISSITGDGIEELIELIKEISGMSDIVFDGSIITNARQAAALARAAERCEEAFFAAQTGMTPDAVVMDAEGAISVLGEITGQAVTDDIIEKIFENFCVGK